MEITAYWRDEAKGVAVHSGNFLPVWRSLSDGVAQVIVTDPPYGIAYHSNHYKDKNPHDPVANDWNFQIGPFFHDAARLLRDGGALYLFTRWDVYPLWLKSLPPALALSNCIVWKKDNWSAGDLHGNYGNQYETLLFITKGRHKRRGYRYSNVWEFARIPSKQLRCAAEKPVGLMRRAIEASSDPGDLVLDPFVGSGTTADAAVQCGRRAIVCDIDPKMVRITIERLGGITPESNEPPPAVPVCPIMQVSPPDPALWGVHPEDLSALIAGVRGEEIPHRNEVFKGEADGLFSTLDSE